MARKTVGVYYLGNDRFRLENSRASVVVQKFSSPLPPDLQENF